MEKLTCFVAIDFTDDRNVAGNNYWYRCPIVDVAVGDKAEAPLGRHNREQVGTVKKVIFAEENNAPYPAEFIKNVRKIIK